MDSGKLIDTLARNVIIPRGRKFSECNDPRNCSRVDTHKRETERRPHCKKRVTATRLDFQPLNSAKFAAEWGLYQSNN